MGSPKSSFSCNLTAYSIIHYLGKATANQYFMINFFRKTRKKLADDNKPLKYARYAIGEILLVVIGILIALQINNWNELKKETDFEHKVLNELNVSIQRNIVHLNRGIKWNNEAIVSCNTILDYFEEGLLYNDTLDDHFSTSLRWYYPTLSNNAYESLKSYGLHLIKNDSLRDALGSTYEWKYVEILDTRQDEYFFSTVAPILTELFDSYEFMGRMKPLDFDELRKSQKYAHILRTMISNREWQNGIFKESLKDREHLSVMIANELNKK